MYMLCHLDGSSCPPVVNMHVMYCNASQYGGGPLYQACALDLPETTALLLNHGASVVQTYKDQTPLQVALGNKDSRCVRVSS